MNKHSVCQFPTRYHWPIPPLTEFNRHFLPNFYQNVLPKELLEISGAIIHLRLVLSFPLHLLSLLLMCHQVHWSKFFECSKTTTYSPAKTIEMEQLRRRKPHTRTIRFEMPSSMKVSMVSSILLLLNNEDERLWQPISVSAVSGCVN